jgi:hypothetical protein
VVVRQRFPEDSSRARRVIEQTKSVLAELTRRTGKTPSSR